MWSMTAKDAKTSRQGGLACRLANSGARPTIATPVTSPPRRLLAASVGQYLSDSWRSWRISPSAVGNTEGTRALPGYLQDSNTHSFLCPPSYLYFSPRPCLLSSIPVLLKLTRLLSPRVVFWCHFQPLDCPCSTLLTDAAMTSRYRVECKLPA